MYVRFNRRRKGELPHSQSNLVYLQITAISTGNCHSKQASEQHRPAKQIHVLIHYATLVDDFLFTLLKNLRSCDRLNEFTMIYNYLSNKKLRGLYIACFILSFVNKYKSLLITYDQQQQQFSSCQQTALPPSPLPPRTRALHTP